MDFQNRVGSKVGAGGVASTSETNRDRKERLRLLALETIDLAKVRFDVELPYCNSL
jgi:splicing factor 3A subunit 2